MATTVRHHLRRCRPTLCWRMAGSCRRAGLQPSSSPGNGCRLRPFRLPEPHSTIRTCSDSSCHLPPEGGSHTRQERQSPSQLSLVWLPASAGRQRTGTRMGKRVGLQPVRGVTSRLQGPPEGLVLARCENKLPVTLEIKAAPSGVADVGARPPRAGSGFADTAGTRIRNVARWNDQRRPTQTVTPLRAEDNLRVAELCVRIGAQLSPGSRRQVKPSLGRRRVAMRSHRSCGFRLGLPETTRRSPTCRVMRVTPCCIN